MKQEESVVFREQKESNFFLTGAFVEDKQIIRDVDWSTKAFFFSIVVQDLKVEVMDVLLNGFRYRLFYIIWDGTSRRRESWKGFKRRVARFCVYRIWRNLIIVYIFIFISANKTIACMCYIVT